MSQVAVAIVDDHPLLVEGIATLLKRRGGFDFAASGCCADEIVAIAETHRPDTMIIDLNMPGDTFQAMSTVCKLVPEMKTVVFTASCSAEDAIRALDSGATAYVLKGSPADELFEALDAVRQDQTYLTPSIATKVISALQRRALERRHAETTRLSVREDQIVRLLLCGKRNREIATALSLSEKTVKGYMTNLMYKLQARNRLEVAIAAQKLMPARSSNSL